MPPAELVIVQRPSGNRLATYKHFHHAEMIDRATDMRSEIDASAQRVE